MENMALKIWVVSFSSKQSKVVRAKPGTDVI